MNPQDLPRRSAWRAGGGWVAGGLLVAGLAAAAWMLPPDGRDRSLPAQALGRFHPLLVHLPIGLLLLVPVLEIAGRAGGAGGASRGGLREAAGFVLALATAAALVTGWDGWLLAWSGGYAGALVLRHLWGGVVLAALCVAALAARLGGRPVGGVGGWIYPLLLTGAIGTLAWTSHEGGSLTHGPHFLTERLPARVQAWLGVTGHESGAAKAAGAASAPTKTAPPAPRTVPNAKPEAAPADLSASGGGGGLRMSGASIRYAAGIAPLLERSCVSCHRPDKHKGGLRLDSYAQMMAGGEDGVVVVPRDPKASELIRRITLPPDDDDYMPSDGRKPFNAEEVRVIEEWIAAGAAGP
jgi:uncharacterized membrane protein